MFGEAFKRKFALTDQGVANVKKGTFWTVIVNFIDFAGILGFLGTLTCGAARMSSTRRNASSACIMPPAANMIFANAVDMTAEKIA